MKTRIEYVERLTGKLKGHKGVVFEDSPHIVHMIDADDYAQEEIDGEMYAPFPRYTQEYKTLSPEKPNFKVGDKVRYNGSKETAIVKQVTLGKRIRDRWYVVTEGSTLRTDAKTLLLAEPEEPTTIYTVYYRHVNDTNVTGVEMNAKNIQHAIEELFEWVNEMDHLEPQDIDVCHVEVSNA